MGRKRLGMEWTMFVPTLGSLLTLRAFPGWMVGLCFAQEKQSQKTNEPSSELSAGAELYKDHCVICHGDALKGSGPFPPPYRVPPDLTTLSQRHAGKFPEAYVLRVPAHGPAEMPVWGTKFEATGQQDKSEVELRIRNLASYINSRQSK
jgi:mono/diheme cytochrome c family protein